MTHITDDAASRASNARTSFNGLFVTLLPTILGLLMAAGGWIASYAATRTTLNEHERRITNVEQTAMTRAAHDALDGEKEKNLIDLKQNLRDLVQEVRELSRELREHDQKARGR